jgi:hypothetical protein
MKLKTVDFLPKLETSLYVTDCMWDNNNNNHNDKIFGTHNTRDVVT